MKKTPIEEKRKFDLGSYYDDILPDDADEVNIGVKDNALTLRIIIPKHIRMEIARCLLPDIVAYFESEQGQREFEEWRKQNMFNGKSYECIKKEINS